MLARSRKDKSDVMTGIIASPQLENMCMFQQVRIKERVCRSGVMLPENSSCKINAGGIPSDNN